MHLKLHNVDSRSKELKIYALVMDAVICNAGAKIAKYGKWLYMNLKQKI